MYSREPRYRDAYSRATPWTVGPSSRSLPAPDEADPLLIIASSAHDKITGHVHASMGGLRSRTARFVMQGSASAPVLNRPFLLQQEVQDRISATCMGSSEPQVHEGAMHEGSREVLQQREALLHQELECRYTATPPRAADTLPDSAISRISTLVGEAISNVVSGRVEARLADASASDHAASESIARAEEKRSAPSPAPVPPGLSPRAWSAGSAELGQQGSQRRSGKKPPAMMAQPTKYNPLAPPPGFMLVKGRPPTPTCRTFISMPSRPPPPRSPPPQPLPAPQWAHVGGLRPGEMLHGQSPAKLGAMATVGLREGPIDRAAPARPSSRHNTPNAPNGPSCEVPSEAPCISARGAPSALAGPGASAETQATAANVRAASLDQELAKLGSPPSSPQGKAVLSGAVAPPAMPYEEPPPPAHQLESARLSRQPSKTQQKPPAPLMGSRLGHPFDLIPPMPAAISAAMPIAAAPASAGPAISGAQVSMQTRAEEKQLTHTYRRRSSVQAAALAAEVSVPTYQPAPTPMGTQLQAPQLVGVSGASAEPRGSQAAADRGEDLSSAEAVLQMDEIERIENGDSYDLAEGYGMASGTPAEVARVAGGDAACAASSSSVAAVPQTRTPANTPLAAAPAPMAPIAEMFTVDEGTTFGQSPPPMRHEEVQSELLWPEMAAEMPTEGSGKEREALAGILGRDLLKRIYAHAIALAERKPAKASGGVTGSSGGGGGGAGASLSGSSPQPLIRHALGKPVGCLCLELCETSAHEALRASLPRLSRVDASAAALVSQLLPLLQELRRRMADARQALQQLTACLPPPPPGATPLGALSVAKSLLAMAAEGSDHPGAEAARAIAPRVSAALDAWHGAQIADALGRMASDLSVHAHTLAGHIRRALPASQGPDLLQGLSQMPPPVAIIHLTSPHRLERLRRIAAWGTTHPERRDPGTNQVPAGLGIGLLSGASCNLPAACASTCSSSHPKVEWAQLLSQQLLCTLWRLHRCGAIDSPSAQHEPDTIAPPLGAGAAIGAPAAEAAAGVAAQRSQRPQPAALDAAELPLHPMRREAGFRQVGAGTATFTKASAKPATKLAPQGVLHRLGQSRPSEPGLPFLAALIVPPNSTAKEGHVRPMQLFHSQSAPGFTGFS